MSYVIIKNSFIRLFKTNIQNSTRLEIVKQLKHIEYERIEQLFLELKENHDGIKPLCIKYNDVTDYFTMEERLNTRGNKNISFYKFYKNREHYDDKIKNMLAYYENKNKNKNKNTQMIRRYKYVYNLYYGSITNFSVYNGLNALKKYKPRCVLDSTCG